MHGILSNLSRGRGRSRVRPVGVAACLVAAAIAAPALAAPDATAGTITWDGGTIALRSVNGVDLGNADDLIWVGEASNFQTVDPRLTCLQGAVLKVYQTHSTSGSSLVFSNYGDPGACAEATLEAVTDRLPSGIAPCVTTECVGEMAAFRATQALQAATFEADFALGTANSLLPMATGEANAAVAGSIPEALAGKLVSQVESLTQLYAMRFSVSLTNLDARFGVTVAGKTVGVASPLRIDPSNAVGCLLDGCPVLDIVGASLNENPVTTNATNRDALDFLGGADPNIEPMRFTYNNGVTPTYSQKGKHGVYGAVIYDIWTLNRKASYEQDFYATSQDASVTPADKSRITKNWTALHSDSDGVRMIEASPMEVSQRGAGETITISATLSGNVSAKKDGTGGEIGGSFGLSRSYTKPEANSGGAALSATGHYAVWETGDNGSGYAKLATGVETWAIPTDSPIGWIWEAHAWWCDDPCGP
jgi:hypothetical protein